jgi:hypothetical protein
MTAAERLRIRQHPGGGLVQFEKTFCKRVESAWLGFSS